MRMTIAPASLGRWEYALVLTCEGGSVTDVFGTRTYCVLGM